MPTLTSYAHVFLKGCFESNWVATRDCAVHVVYLRPISAHQLSYEAVALYSLLNKLLSPYETCGEDGIQQTPLLSVRDFESAHTRNSK